MAARRDHENRRRDNSLRLTHFQEVYGRVSMTSGGRVMVISSPSAIEAKV